MSSDELVEWLTATLDALERQAQQAADTRRRSWWTTTTTVGDYFNYPTIVVGDGPDTDLADGTTDVLATLDWLDGASLAEHIALHDPRAILARVKAERAVVSAFLAACDDAQALADGTETYQIDEEFRDQLGGAAQACEDGLHDALCLLAWGHRYDAPGYDETWAPDRP